MRDMHLAVALLRHRDQCASAAYGANFIVSNLNLTLFIKFNISL